MLFQRKRFPKKLKAPKRNAPNSAEEFLEQGSVDEESGDRWLSSDLSKALRFYQKAYDEYLQVVVQPQSTKDVFIDAVYNGCRLVYHVHSHYIKLEGVDVTKMTSVEEVVGSSHSVLVSDIQDIVQMHQQAIERIVSMDGTVPLDLLYNAVVVLTEDIEQLDEELEKEKVLQQATATKQILIELLDRQYKELEALDFQLQQQEPENDALNQNQELELNEGKQEEMTTETVVQPPDVYDSLIAGLEFIHAVVEKDLGIEVELLYEVLSSFEQRLERFSSENQALMLASISLEQIQKWNILLLAIRSINQEPLCYWKDALDDSTLTASSYETIVDSIELYLANNDVSPEQEWELLSFTNELYKRQQALVTKRLADEAKNDGLGNALVQMSGLMLDRGDLEMERRQIGYKQDLHPLLRNNAIAYYKNALSYAQRSGGLRERIIDKLQRQRKALQAATKLKILDGTVTEAELASVFGPEWKDELSSIIE